MSVLRILRTSAVCLVMIIAAGCARVPPVHPPIATVAPLPQVQGSYYQVQRGESLWGIAHDFGWDVHALAKINRLSNVRQVKVGQRLFIPPPPESNRFLWPARGTVVSTKETGGDAAAVRGLEIQAQAGAIVRASRTGRVAVATRQLSGWGKTILLDHGDGYVTVYARLDQLLVSPGMNVQQGNPVGQAGRAPLYFEIRYGTSLRDPLQLLPS